MASVPSSQTLPKGCIRALGNYEDEAFRLARHDNFIIVYNLTISSSKPVNDQHMKTSMEHMMRIYPLLRMSIDEHHGVAYFKEMEKIEVDYQQLSGNWLEHYNCLMNTTFDEQGPLWRARLIELDLATGERPYRYVVLLSWIHSISDGTSNMRMCNRIMQILDSVLDGAQVIAKDECKLYPSQEDMLPQREYLWSEVFPVLKKEKENAEIAAWSKYFPALQEDHKTLFLDGGFLDETTTALLVKRCKENGVSVNGALTVALNTAFYNFYIEQGVHGNEPLKLKTEMCVNLRRFMKETEIFGLNMNVLVVPFTIDDSTERMFWESSKEATTTTHKLFFSDEFKTRIHTTDHLHDVELGVKELKENPACHLDYIVTNILDVSKTCEFSGSYKNIGVDWLSHSTSVHFYGAPLVFYATTFRGKFYLSVDYVPHLAKEGQAKDIIGRAMATLTRVAHG